MQLPKRSSLRLQSDIEQCEAALADKTNSLQHSCASARKDLRSLRREFNQVKDSRDPAKLNKLVEKRDLLKLKVEALETGLEQFRAQQQKQLNLLDEVPHETHTRMHGLLAYALATGDLSPDATLLFNTLGDLLEAKTDNDRAAGRKAVSLILDHGDVFGDKNDGAVTGDDELLRRFEMISDPEERSAFYNQNRAEIHRGFEARKNNNL